MTPKIFFPFTENNNNSDYNIVSRYTKFGYIKDGKDFLDTSLGSCGSFMLGFDRTDIIDYVSNRSKEIPFEVGNT